MAAIPEFRFLQMTPKGRPYRWDPCSTIHYEVNASNAPTGALGALEDVQGAVSRVAEASGLRFVFDGVTTRTADRQLRRGFLEDPHDGVWLPVLIVWVEHSRFDELANSHHAVAFGMPRTGLGPDRSIFESGLVAVDAGEALPRGFAVRYSEGVVLMHELAHVVGLAHVASGNELMWSPDVRGADPFPNLDLNDWGPGDLDGLRILGRHGSCPPG